LNTNQYLLTSYFSATKKLNKEKRKTKKDKNITKKEKKIKKERLKEK